MSPNTRKRCTKCGSKGPFGEAKSTSDGLNYWCKECVRENAAKLRQKATPEEREKARIAKRKWEIEHPGRKEAWLRRSKLKPYGITPEQYDAMLADQGGVCVICGQPETATMNGKVMQLAVDHKRGTTLVRGLLCSNCNQGIGRFKESVELLHAAIAYLAKHRAQ